MLCNSSWGTSETLAPVGGQTEYLDTNPSSEDPNDPIGPGKTKYPSKWIDLPKDLNPNGRKDCVLNNRLKDCEGCYAELPPWLRQEPKKMDNWIKK